MQTGFRSASRIAEWKKLESRHLPAKTALASLRENVELSEEERVQKTKALNDVIFRTFTSENQALQSDVDCVQARKELDAASERLQQMRKKLTPDEVNSPRSVVLRASLFLKQTNSFRPSSEKILIPAAQLPKHSEFFNKPFRLWPKLNSRRL